MKGSQQPSQPNPYQVSQAQTVSNVNTALANEALNPNVVSPWGTTTTSPSSAQIGGQTIQRPTQTITLSPMAQKLFEQNQALQLQTGGLAGKLEGSVPTTGLDYSGAQKLPTNFDQMNQQASDAAYRASTQYLDPQWAEQEKALDAQLQAQGARPGMPAYEQAKADFGRQKQAAYADARNQAVNQGFQIANQGFNQALASRQQGVSEANQMYSAPVSTLAQLMSSYQGGNVTGAPAYSGQPGQVAPTDVSGIFSRGAQNQQQQWATNQALMGQNIGSLAGVAGMLALA